MNWPRSLRYVLALLLLPNGAGGAIAEMEFLPVEEKVRLTIPEAGIRSIGVKIWTAKTIPDLKKFDVLICLTKYQRNRLCDFSRQHVGRPVELRMGCEPLAKPVIRESLCGSCFALSAEDLADAERQVAKLRAASRISCRPPTS